MSRLPDDYARCSGVFAGGEWREGCERCLRRTAPVKSSFAVMMEPPPIIAFECEYLIESAQNEGG